MMTVKKGRFRHFRCASKTTRKRIPYCVTSLSISELLAVCRSNANSRHQPVSGYVTPNFGSTLLTAMWLGWRRRSDGESWSTR